MLRHLHKRSTWMLLAGLAMGLLVGVGMMIGTLVAVRSAPATGLSLPETLLHATASHSGKSMAMATGYGRRRSRRRFHPGLPDGRCAVLRHQSAHVTSGAACSSTT